MEPCGTPKLMCARDKDVDRVSLQKMRKISAEASLTRTCRQSPGSKGELVGQVGTTFFFFSLTTYSRSKKA